MNRRDYIVSIFLKRTQRKTRKFLFLTCHFELIFLSLNLPLSPFLNSHEAESCVVPIVVGNKYICKSEKLPITVFLKKEKRKKHSLLL